jgi:hypothetical protein
VPGSGFEGEGVNRQCGYERNTEGSGEALGGGKPDSNARVETGAHVDDNAIEILRRPPNLGEAEVDRRNQETGMTHSIDSGRSSESGAILH